MYRIRKSLIYQSFVLVKQLENESTSGRDRPSCLLIVPLRSIGEEHINSNDFDLSVKGFEKNVDVLNEMKNNNFQVIYPSAGQALSRDYDCSWRCQSMVSDRLIAINTINNNQ